MALVGVSRGEVQLSRQHLAQPPFLGVSLAYTQDTRSSEGCASGNRGIGSSTCGLISDGPEFGAWMALLVSGVCPGHEIHGGPWPQVR